MSAIAIVDKYNSGTDYTEHFQFLEHHEYEVFHLCDTNVKRVLKKDITLVDFEPEDYDYVILVGAEPCKHIAKITSVTKYQGYLIEDKFLPITNPAMLLFKPDGATAFNKAVADMERYVSGKVVETTHRTISIEDENELEALLQFLIDNRGRYKLISLDSETTALYARDGYILGVALAYTEDTGYYISSDCISEKASEMFQEIFRHYKVVFHNKKFDMSFFKYHFGWKFYDVEDTMLMHYMLNEQVGTHDLKTLSIKFTDLGDYDRDLETFKTEYCKRHSLRKGDFTYDLIPFDVMVPYAATDAIATFRLYPIFREVLDKSVRLTKAYRNLLIEGSKFLLKVEDNGVPFDRSRLENAQQQLDVIITDLQKKFYDYDEVHALERGTGKLFNPNSVPQLRTLFFSLLGLPEPSKLTSTGLLSVDAEVLTELSKLHELPKIVLEYKKALKIKSTYIDKALANLDMDGRLRTGFNLTTTTSGRLSSSGKLNMQQLPRDDKLVKYCIKAREGYVIVSQDLQTAEMYVVAVLSGDLALQNIFSSGGDFHSSVAKMVFKLDCPVAEVKALYPDLRQAAKAVSFGILYGSGPKKVAETVGCSLAEAKGHIARYFSTFKKLAEWLQEQQDFIKQNGYTYSFFGRKRRLPNVFSKDTSVSSHEVRSGVNALVQGPASDINLLAGIDAQKEIEKLGLDVKIFGLVHDSILAEVAIKDLEEYKQLLAKCTQKDRGLSIPGHPIGIDVEVGFDYSFKEAA